MGSNKYGQFDMGKKNTVKNNLIFSGNEKNWKR